MLFLPNFSRLSLRNTPLLYTDFTIETKHERVLSSQALDVRRSLGQGLGRAKSSTVQTFDPAVQGYHVYKVVWKPATGEKLLADQEYDNEVNKFAGEVVKNNETVGHFLREYSQIL